VQPPATLRLRLEPIDFRQALTGPGILSSAIILHAPISYLQVTIPL
jgi:hypothetical protein